MMKSIGYLVCIIESKWKGTRWKWTENLREVEFLDRQSNDWNSTRILSQDSIARLLIDAGRRGTAQIRSGNHTGKHYPWRYWSEDLLVVHWINFGVVRNVRNRANWTIESWRRACEYSQSDLL